MSRGVEVLRMKRGVNAAGSMKSVTAPSVRSDRFAAKPVGGLSASKSAEQRQHDVHLPAVQQLGMDRGGRARTGRPSSP